MSKTDHPNEYLLIVEIHISIRGKQASRHKSYVTQMKSCRNCDGIGNLSSHEQIILVNRQIITISILKILLLVDSSAISS